jgi:hypothetical protein
VRCRSRQQERHSRSVHKFNCCLRIGHAGLVDLKVIFFAADAAKLSLD